MYIAFSSVVGYALKSANQSLDLWYRIVAIVCVAIMYIIQLDSILGNVEASVFNPSVMASSWRVLIKPQLMLIFILFETPAFVIALRRIHGLLARHLDWFLFDMLPGLLVTCLPSWFRTGIRLSNGSYGCSVVLDVMGTTNGGLFIN